MLSATGQGSVRTAGYPTERASDKPFLHPTKSLKATTKLQIIDGSPSSQGIQNVEPFFLFLTRKRSQDKLKEAKQVG